MFMQGQHLSYCAAATIRLGLAMPKSAEFNALGDEATAL